MLAVLPPLVVRLGRFGRVCYGRTNFPVTRHGLRPEHVSAPKPPIGRPNRGYRGR